MFKSVVVCRFFRLGSSSIRRRRLSVDESPKTFSVCTLNVLAPCYKRLSSESDRESTHSSLWQSRHRSLIDLLQSLNSSLICLQEFWFKNVTFAQLYKSSFLSRYSFYSLSRTGSLDDGLAILVDQNLCQVKDKCELILNDVGNRVGLLLQLDYQGRTILLVNLHLTFPHHRFERRVRFKQMRRFLQLIDQYQHSHQLVDRCSVILAGDFNSPHPNDPVYQLISKEYRSSYRTIHGEEPLVTHLTHRHEELGVDFIFYRSSDQLRAVNSELIPRGCDPSRWTDHTQWTLSDHRAVLSTFQF